MMQELVAGVEKVRFDLEADVEQQRGARPLSFLGMDKLGAAVCEFFHRGLCPKGVRCPFRHVSGEKMVCKHWVRGPCTKGDGCDFLHEYDVTKMPKCYFYSKFGECSNKDCPFLHIDATASTTGCLWYDRGFCRHGPLCKYKHTRRVMCANYLIGFCPEGPQCKFTHLKAGLMTSSTDPSKAAGCPQGLVQLDLAAGEESERKDVPPMEPAPPVTGATQHLAAQLWDTRSCPSGPQSLLERGTCFKCGQKGH
ncbi:putative cleavage and polyadenylation specificity factor subunit 4-like protein [Gymnogyps californianus]|uniref:putative cleavage and polyadenylation specificity factor subunit 4-like protein n=1 Tax=Gymnogyps californianus TaxID=33616 RepID=UPI0021C944C0|nr:putative cleavage and polyadenylation specificity factor subunit 4-like protein [Gymnogyps californianus]